jgi:hypothetical protein
MRAKEFTNTGESRQRFIEMFEKFLPLAMKYLKLERLPKMVFEKHIKSVGQPTFGMYVNGENTLYVALVNRHPNDILRTIAHELTHYKQDTEHKLHDESGTTGSPEENEANAMAGIVMRHFNKMYPEYLSDRPVIAESAAWHRKAGKNKNGGLNDKGIASYRREHPGSHLQKAVTTKPSKLKAGSKAAKRRKSFCARMSGVKGPMKKPNGKPTRKALALRKWNCESVENMIDMILENMNHDKDNQAVPELKAALLAKKDQLQNATDDQVYDIIDTIMTRIAKSHGISGQKLHDMWVDEYDQVPDTWIMK